MDTKSSCILSLDVGTTTVRAFVYDDEGQVLGQAADKIDLILPKPGRSEIEPDALWDLVQDVMNKALKG